MYLFCNLSECILLFYPRTLTFIFLSGSGPEKRLTAVGIRCADHVTPLYPQKLALTSPTGGGRSVGIVRSRTKATKSLHYTLHILLLHKASSLYATAIGGISKRTVNTNILFLQYCTRSPFVPRLSWFVGSDMWNFLWETGGVYRIHAYSSLFVYVFICIWGVRIYLYPLKQIEIVF